MMHGQKNIKLMLLKLWVQTILFFICLKRLQVLTSGK